MSSILFSNECRALSTLTYLMEFQLKTLITNQASRNNEIADLSAHDAPDASSFQSCPHGREDHDADPIQHSQGTLRIRQISTVRATPADLSPSGWSSCFVSPRSPVRMRRTILSVGIIPRSRLLSYFVGIEAPECFWFGGTVCTRELCQMDHMVFQD